LGVLFSGGKDSVFACYRALEKNDVACLISLLSENQESYMFHTPNIGLVSKQAEAMGIPLLSWPTRGEKEKELADLRSAILAVREEFGLQGIVTGAIESVYQAVRVQRICRDLGLWCFNPLWQSDQLEHLRLVLAEGFQVLISGVFAYPFDASWLGAILDEERIQQLALLQKRYRISPAGEGGELETFVQDGPIFKKRIEIVRALKTYGSYRGRFIIQEARLVDKGESMLVNGREPEAGGQARSRGSGQI
jgi:ABC transporter with metal-binding/Fe-S-binding domain ATP-binding protein